MPFWYQSQALPGAVTASPGTRGGEAAFPTNSVFLSHFIMFHTLLLFPQATGLRTSEICKCISATNTEFCCFWDYLFMNLKVSACEKFLIKCPGCKLCIDRIIIACLEWSLHNPFKITLKIKKETLTAKNSTIDHLFLLLKNGKIFTIFFHIFVFFSCIKTWKNGSYLLSVAVDIWCNLFCGLSVYLN